MSDQETADLHALSPAKPTLEVFADIWCPFAHAGLRMVVARRREFGREDVALRVRAWPLELVNGAPLDPETTAHHVADLRRFLGDSLFTGFDRSCFPRTTLPALALVSAAYRCAPRLGEQLSMTLRDALFEDGCRIDDPNVLTAMACRYGLEVGATDHATVMEDWRVGQRRSVIGSPHFFCGDHQAFCPSLSIARESSGALLIQPDRAKLDGFLRHCFGLPVG